LEYEKFDVGIRIQSGVQGLVTGSPNNDPIYCFGLWTWESRVGKLCLTNFEFEVQDCSLWV
jgi:hypothetical protein